jgi:pimeloyl-ACP methyl ester carboxylesterase
LPYGDIETHTLVIHGTADEVVPPGQAELAAGSIPQAEMVEIEGGGHLAAITHREEVSLALERFLKTIVSGEVTP